MTRDGLTKSDLTEWARGDNVLCCHCVRHGQRYCRLIRFVKTASETVHMKFLGPDLIGAIKSRTLTKL